MNRNKQLARISLILVAVLIFTAVFNMAYTGAVNFGGGSVDPAQVATANSSIRKSDMNMDSIREKYLNFETVEKNTAAFDGERWVIVEIDASSLYDEFKKSTRFTDLTEYLKSVEAQKALASLRAKQSRFLSKLDKYGIDYTFKYNYSTLSAGVAIKINASAYNTISAMSGVKGVYYSESYAVPEYTAIENNANVYSTGIYDTKDLIDVNKDGDGKEDTYQGQGMAVAILDTGLDHTHEAFNVTKFLERLEKVDGELRYSKDQIADLLEKEDFKAEQFGSGINDVYYNEKVPFAYDYSDDDPIVFPGYSNHGTHVAGIVAGQDDTYVVNDNGTPNDKSDDETFRGVAPLAQLVICKVFTDNLYSDMIGGANDIDIVAALEDCVRLGVDVINMSLGTSAGFADENSQDHQTEVYYEIREAGISLVCAASNDYSSGYGGGNGTNLASNPDSGTVGSPSTYYSALSVASINGKKSKYLQGNGDTEQVAFITNSSDGDGNRIEFIEELYKQLEEKYGDENKELRGGDVFDKEFGKDELNLKYVLVGGVGRPNNYSSTIRNQLRTRTYNGKAVDGTIALIKRGDTSFEDKVLEAMSNGADAVIIYNNVSGTINMSLGEVNDPVPTCLITMDASAPFVDFAKSNGNIGTIQVSDSFEAGPFMSDFSSWGPVSNLTLKPEITAHGGEITSSVPGAYDVLSGTSMASPNMAGAVAVLRQYLQETTDLTGNALNARVNQVLMSTATIARNEEGNPYSPRKQGAGLAGISDAVFSEGYITVKANEKIYSKDNAATEFSIVADEKCEEWLDKTKLELLDDPERKGVYELNFTVHNISTDPQVYVPTTYVMTETLASDKRTVAEKAYMLTDMCTIEYSGTGYADGKITVQAGQSVDITVKITLGKEARDYFEQQLSRTVIGTNGRPVTVDYKPFENGMYVEGFVSLDNVTYQNQQGHKDGVTLGVPYLAFYGAWSDAPLFDYDVYEVSEIEANSAIDFENKLKATSLPSQVIGMYHNDDYIIPLGSYLYEMDEEEDDIYPARDKIALSQYDQEGSYTVYELYAAYAGLLRNASKVRTVVTNAKTGEVVYEEILANVGKAYSAGGGNRGAFVRYEINPSKWGWQNNDEFYFKVEGWLDYEQEKGEKEGDPKKPGKPLDYSKEINPAQSTAEDDEILTAWTGVRNTFEFPLTIDYEAPQITDYKIRFDSYKEYGVTKYRTYLDLDVYDNQYVMAVLPCYLKEEKEGKLGTYLNLLTEYPIPVYGEKGATSKVSIDITDYYEEYLLNEDNNDDKSLFIQVEDYAMNSEVYIISLDEDSLSYPEDPEDITFISDSKLKETERLDKNDDGTLYHNYTLTLTPFELYKLNVPSELEKEFITQNLSWKGANDCVIVQGDEIFALKDGYDPTLELYAPMTREVETGDVSYDRIYAKITVQVEPGPQQKMPSASSLNFKPVHAGDNHVVNLDGLATVEVNPNENSSDEEFVLEPYVSPWYFEAAYYVQTGKNFEFTFESNRENIAEVDENGTVTFKKRGTASITCQAKDQTYKLLTKTVDFEVGEDYYVNNFYMYEWYGGEKVELPTDVNVLYLDEDCFKNDDKITEVVLPSMLMEIPNFAFQNCKNLKKITIPSQCAYIGPYAFDGCTNLETVIFPEYVDANKDPVPGYYGSIAVGHYAFSGCTSLKNFVTGKEVDGKPVDSQRMTVMYDGAFEGCTGLESIDLSALRVAGNGVFRGCTGLESVTTTASTTFGPHMFDGCVKLNNITFNGSTLPAYAFNGCKGLTNFTFGGQELLGIGDYALAGTGITDITLPVGEYPIGSGAFANLENLTLTVKDGTTLKFTGENPFEGCKNLQYTVNGSAYKEVDGALYSADGATLISAPSDKSDYKLPTDVTTIGDGALSGSAVTTLDLKNVTKIGKYAFAGSKLTSINWPESIEEIPEGAFSGCTALTQVTTTQNVKKIGAYAFEGCTALTALYFTNVTEVGDHAFDMMDYRSMAAATNKLATVDALALEKIGAWAFAGTAITNASYPKTTEIGAWAFAYSKVLTVNLGAKKVENGEKGTVIGDHAFYKALYLTTVTLADGTEEIGDYAFSTFDPRLDNMTRQEALFSGSVSDNVKAYVRQNYMDITVNTRLTQVTLPATVKRIGAYAFTGQAGLKGLTLDGVTEIGDNAFRLCSALTGLNLSKVEKIGDYAFYGSALKEVALDKAQVIGAYAFAGSKYVMFSETGDGKSFSANFHIELDFRVSRNISGGQITKVTLGAATRIGDFAFAGNDIRNSVVIPATMNSTTYEFVEDIYDEKGRVERSRKRIGNTFGAGVFAYNPYLTSIDVAQGNDAFTSIDGVLYAYQYTANDKGELVKNGKLELVQYPGGKRPNNNSRKYTVADDTVSIAASAFEGANENAVQVVELPYTVKVIGSSAFYGTFVEDRLASTGIMKYTFNSVQAPTIVAANDDVANEMFKGLFASIYYSQGEDGAHYFPWQIDPKDGDMRLDLDDIYLTAVYSNFVDYVLYCNYGNSMFAFNDVVKEAMPIIFNVPKNGVGYDSALFKAYVTTTNLSEDIKPDDTTYEVINKIEELGKFNVGDIPSMSKEDLAIGANSKNALVLAVNAAREAYNKVTSADQQELLTEQYETLLKFEEALRNARKANGIEVTLQEVVKLSSPTKIRYDEGEKFDPTGMVIRVVYSDGSELRISAEDFEKYNVKINNETVTAAKTDKGDPIYPEVVYTDALTGQTRTLEIVVNVNSTSNPSNPSGDENTNNASSLPTWAIAIIAVGAAVVVAAVVAIVILVFKKKGKGAKAVLKESASTDGAEEGAAKAEEMSEQAEEIADTNSDEQE